MSAATAFLAFAHIGDLHLTGPDAENAHDYRMIVDQIATAAGLDFVYLPGDNADNGRPEQYTLVRAGLGRLRQPVHVITGDHDMEGGSLDAFYAGLAVPELPYAVEIGGVRCLFLDMCGPGGGGQDFRLGPDQIGWLERELAAATGSGTDCALFMHSYPGDLKEAGEAARVADLVHRGPVRLVEMGHTHYNELANDGRTVYAAARSTGQIEEGPIGYAVAAMDAGIVSWRFKDLAAPWPFVLITAPADRRLAPDAADPPGAETEIRALVLAPEPVAACAYSVDGGPWLQMACQDGVHRYAARLRWPDGARQLAVRATDAAGRENTDVIEPMPGACAPRSSKGYGTDADAIGAWLEKGLLGTQLGPNRNGRPW